MRADRRMRPLLTALILIMGFAACSNEQAVSPSPDGTRLPVSTSATAKPAGQDADAPASSGKDGEETPRYIFTGGLLLGSVDGDGWHSLCDTGGEYGPGDGDAYPFYVRDLLAVSGYRLWSDGEYAGEADRIVWDTQEYSGVGSFEVEGVGEKFGKYGEPYTGYGVGAPGYRALSLPTAPGEELSDLRVPNYSFQTDFILAGESEAYPSPLLASNGDVSVLPRPTTRDAAPTAEGTEALLALFREAGMTDTPPNFTDCWWGDFDGDGKRELLMAANTPVDEGRWPMVAGEGDSLVEHGGTFSALLYQGDDGTVSVLHSDLRPLKESVTLQNGGYTIMDIDHCHTVDVLSAADLNGDGRFELIVTIGLWEGGYTLAYSLDGDGSWTPVLRTNWGT